MLLEESLSVSSKSNWVKWTHENIPDHPEWLRTITRAIAAIFGHCLECTVLSGCYFANEESKHPQHPLHDNCHCGLNKAMPPTVSASCAVEKFTKYIFADKYAANGKRKLFEQLGFTIEDSAKLQSEFERQAASKYKSSEYELGKLDMRGQRMNISIEFPHKTKGAINFISGWMIHPCGYITCNTPLSYDF